MGLVIIDSKVEASVQRFFEKLEKYYPEHKVFAFDSIDKNLRETMASLVKKTGCSSAQEFLEAYGYEIITSHEVKKIRSKVIYTPGNEPEIVKNKVDNLIAKLWEYYPDGVVSKLQAQHKNVSKSLSGLYQWLGYESNAKMLEAYGFKSESKESGGRPSNDYRALIDELLKRYENKKKVETVGLLLHENQDMASNIKTLQNKANELFGKTLAAYFNEIGLLKEVVKEENYFFKLSSYKDAIIKHIKDNPEYKEQFIEYFVLRWASEDSSDVYIDCISNVISTIFCTYS
mgnify:CR=1 FL=1